MAVKIIPSEDGAYTVVSVGEQIWRKKYLSTKPSRLSTKPSWACEG